MRVTSGRDGEMLEVNYHNSWRTGEYGSEIEELRGMLLISEGYKV